MDDIQKLVLTLQNIMYSDSELNYITNERNITQLIIERIYSLSTEDLHHKMTYRYCILIKKSTVDYFESMGYNLFRQFHTSDDCAYYKRPLVKKSDGAAYEICELVTVLKYSLDIYCYVTPDTTSSRSLPVVTSTIYVSTRTNNQNSSELTADTPSAHNLNGLEYISDVSHPASEIPISSSSYTNELIWGSTSRLPTALVEPLPNTFWNHLSSEDPSSSDSDELVDSGGVFVKLTTLNSTRPVSNSTPRGSGPDVSVGEIRDAPNLKEVYNQDPDENPTVSAEDVPMWYDSPGTSGGSSVSSRTDSPEMSGEGRNGDPEMYGEGIVLGRNANPGMSDEGTVSRRNADPGISGDGTPLTINFNQTTLDSEVAGCFEKMHFDLGEVKHVDNRVKEEYENSGKLDVSLENDFKTISDDIQINGREGSGISIQTKEKLRTQINKRTASGLAESPGSSLWCSKESKQRKLSSYAAEFSPSQSTNAPLDISTSVNIIHSVNNCGPQESTIEDVEYGSYNEYTNTKLSNASSTLLSNNIEQSVVNTPVKVVTNINNEHAIGDKSIQKEWSDDKLGQNVSSMVMSSSSNNNHTTIEHSDPITVVELECPRKLSNDHQHSSFTNIQQYTVSHDHIKTFDTLQESRDPCENRSHLDRIEKEINSAPIPCSNDMIFSKSGATPTIDQQTSFDQTKDKILSSELVDNNEGMPFDNSKRPIDGYFPSPIDTSESMPEQITEASKSSLNPKNHASLLSLNVPLVWNRKYQDLLYLLSLKVSQPHLCIQEYNRIRKSRLNILHCLRKRESSGSIHQTKVMEVIAQPHYNIYPPADEEDIRTTLEDNENEGEMDMRGYLMLSLENRKTFPSSKLEVISHDCEKKDKNLTYVTQDCMDRVRLFLN